MAYDRPVLTDEDNIGTTSVTVVATGVLTVANVVNAVNVYNAINVLSEASVLANVNVAMSSK